MEVVVQSSTVDNFDFSGAMTSPYLSAPSSPKRFGEYYLSAPSSPSRLSEFYHELDYFPSSINIADSASSTNNVDGDEDDDGGFAFFVSRESDKSSRSAEELFDGGKIKPLKPDQGNESFTSHNRSEEKKVLQAFSSKKKNKSHSGDPFAPETEQRRGRDRTPSSVLSSSNSGRRVTRSHSPYRISHYTWEEEQHPQQQQPRSNKEETTTSSSNSRASLSSTSSSSSKGSKRWRFMKDFLLFRSASEGRGSSKDPFKMLYKKPEEVKASSFRSSESAHGSRRKGPVSAHEFHYAMKKAESKDLKKRTYLPYKQGILGRLAGFGF